MTWGQYHSRGYHLGAEPAPGRTASSYREHRGPVAHPPAVPPPRPVEEHPRPRRHHHFHDYPPYPHRYYNDYALVEGWGWWPRWFPYWDQRWYSYWWYLYDYYGGDAYPDYAEYARDAVIRQYAPQWGLVVSGAWTGADPQAALAVRDHRGGLPARDHRGSTPTHGAPTLSPGGGFVPTHGSPLRPPDYDDRHGRRYRHPHDYYGDYVIVESAWWPRWFPYWDPNWIRYWWQLYYAYGGDAYADYAQYARDAYLRALATQWGWI